MTNFLKVKTFMSIFGQEIKTKPGLPAEQILRLRLKLIKEEFDELKYIAESKGFLFNK